MNRRIVAALALATAMLAAAPALATTFVVDSTSEAPDADVGDGACATASGTCTLRAALAEADALGKSVEILRPSLGDRSALRAVSRPRPNARAARVPPTATFTVDTTADAIDLLPGDGVCATADGVCSLRAAIQEANELDDVQAIVLPAGTYALTLVGDDEDAAATGDLDVLEPVVLTGAGSDLTIIDASGTSRVFDNFTGPFVLSGVQLANGVPQGLNAEFGSAEITNCSFVGNATGLRQRSGDLLTVTGSRFEGNDEAAFFTTCQVDITDTVVEQNGSGFYFDENVGGTLSAVAFRLNDGNAVSVIVGITLTLTDVEMSENGTGFAHLGGDFSNTITIEDSVIVENTGEGIHYADGRLTVATTRLAENGDCGLSITGHDGGSLTLRDSSVEQNGCGVNVNGGRTRILATIERTRIADNDGVGLSVSGSPDGTRVTVDDSTLVRNHGGGMNIFAVNGSNPFMRMAGCTIADNQAERGAGIFMRRSNDSNRSSVRLVNTTISGNVATAEVDGILNEGGDLDLRNVTVADHAGEGLLVRDGATVTTRNSILDGGCSGTVTSAGYNLMSPGCNVVGDLTGNLSGDPLLGVLGDNGGPTVTHALLPASPVRDAGDPAGCRDLDDALLVTDQRGSARPELGRCDIGAFEATCGNGTVDPGETCDDGNDDDGDCCSATCQPVQDGTSCSDANACSTGDTCHGGVCTAGAAEDCGPCLTCDPGVGCVAHVLPSCHQPTERFSGELEITAKPTRKIEWFWVEGEATTRAEIGNPLGDDRYAFCLFDESQSTPRLAFRAATRPDPCGKKSCWKPTGKTGFQYSAPASDELRKMVLKTGRDGKAKVTVIAKGPELALPPLPASLPLRAQLHAENGRCWEARFFPLGASKNDAKIFRGKAFLQ